MMTNRYAASLAKPVMIAIVEHDEKIAKALTAWIIEMGHASVWYNASADFLKAVRTREFSLVLLEWDLPDSERDELVRQLRTAGPINTPIIVFTARGAKEDVAAALAVVADDFIFKPVCRDELAARVGAALRRAYPRQEDGAMLNVPPFSIDLTNRMFHVDGQRIELPNQEFEIALMLFQNLNDVVPRLRIIQSLWDGEPLQNSRSLDTHISRIRRKLALNTERGLIIQSVYARGYRLQVVAMPPRDAGRRSPA